MDWVSNPENRIDKSLSEALAASKAEMPWLLTNWFVTDRDKVVPLYPLRELGYYTRTEWIDRLAVDPVIGDDMKSKLFSLAGET